MFEVVFENPHFIAVDKPAGWLTVPSRFESSDARKVLGREVETSLGVRLYPIHRLDFEVSGLVLFAKTPEAHRKASHWFEHRELRKTYQALSGERSFAHWPENLPASREEIPAGEEVVWKSRILRGKRRSYEHAKGDPAVTRASWVGGSEAGQNQRRWTLIPETGRAHQLRFEMSRHGFPILGDSLYGSKAFWPGENAIALRAISLDFSHLSEGDRKGLPDRLSVKGLFE